MSKDRDTSRNRRIADQIQRELSELIRLELRDPRVSMVTITDVEVANDNSHAKVFFTTIGSDAQIESCGHGLTRAAGFLRSQLASRLTIRTVPSLHFEYDASIERGMRLSKLIDDAVADDAKKAP
jgi:ribosome-binding factor A